MACPGSGSTGTKTVNWPFENWARTQRVSVPTVYHPTSVQEIVATVLEVEDRQENVKAIGSGWAYGAVAVDESTKNVIATRGLQKKLSGSDPTKGMIPFALRDELKPPPTRYLHVEAGIEIWRLNCMLDEQLLAMSPAMRPTSSSRISRRESRPFSRPASRASGSASSRPRRGIGAPRCVSTPTPREARSSSRWRASA